MAEYTSDSRSTGGVSLEPILKCTAGLEEKSWKHSAIVRDSFLPNQIRCNTKSSHKKGSYKFWNKNYFL